MANRRQRREPIDTRELARELAELLGKPKPRTHHTLQQLSEMLLPRLMRRLKYPHDIEIGWRLHLLPELGTKTEESLTSDDIVDTLEGLHASPRTWNKTRWAGMHLLEHARARGLWFGPNPFAAVDTRRVKKRRVRVLQPGEFWRVLQEAAPHRRALFAAAYLLGARKSMLLGWRRENIDIRLRTYSFLDTKNGEDMLGLPIPDSLVPLLEAQLASHDSPWVFPVVSGARKGKRHRPDTKLEREFRGMLGRAGFVDGCDFICRRCRRSERHADNASRRCDVCGMRLWTRAAPWRLRFHDLRHMTSTLLQERGVPRAVVKRLLGHRSGDITDLYTHHTEAFMRQAVNRLHLGPDPDDDGSTSDPFRASNGSRRPTSARWTSNPKVGGSTPSGRAPPPQHSRLRTDPYETPVSQGFALLSPKEVAERLGIDRETVYRLIYRGGLVAYRVGSVLRIRPDDVTAFLQGSSVGQKKRGRT